MPLGISLITLWLLMRYRSRRRQPQPRITPHEQLEQMKQARGMRGDLEHLMVEIEQLAKRFSAQLDAKSIQLQQLLGQADQTISQLQQLLEQQQIGQVKAAGEHQDRVSLETGRDLFKAPVNPSGGTEDALAKSVYQLADQGITPLDIARQLDEQVGKIELIIALRGG